MTLLCLPLSAFVSHGVSGCWAEMTLLCLPLSAFVSHGVFGCWGEMILLCRPSSLFDSRYLLRLPLLFGVDAGVIIFVRADGSNACSEDIYQLMLALQKAKGI